MLHFMQACAAGSCSDVKHSTRLVSSVLQLRLPLGAGGDGGKVIGFVGKVSSLLPQVEQRLQ